MDEDLGFTYGKIFSLSLGNMMWYYEFENEKIFENKENKKNILKSYAIATIYKNLYFEKINEEDFHEIISGTIFHKVEENIYYNEETGLYFNDNNCTEICLSDIVNSLTRKYTNAIDEYFEVHRELKKQDDSLVRKAQMLLLQKGTLR